MRSGASQACPQRLIADCEKRALAVSTVEVDLEPIVLDQRIAVAWQGKSVFIDHRTPEKIACTKVDNGTAILANWNMA